MYPSRSTNPYLLRAKAAIALPIIQTSSTPWRICGDILGVSVAHLISVICLFFAVACFLYICTIVFHFFSLKFHTSHEI